MEKSPEAFRTISEVAEWLDTPAHVLRFWESRFTQIKPVKRAGGRRYFRPADMALLGGIKKLLHEDGMTIRGAQKMLREKGVRHVAAMSPPLEDGRVAVPDVEGAGEEPRAVTDAPDPEAEDAAAPTADGGAGDDGAADGETADGGAGDDEAAAGAPEAPAAEEAAMPGPTPEDTATPPDAAAPEAPLPADDAPDCAPAERPLAARLRARRAAGESIADGARLAEIAAALRRLRDRGAGASDADR